MDKEIVVFIESNTSGSGFLFLKKAIEMDFEVVFLSQNPTYYPFLDTLDIRVVKINTLDLIAIQRHLAQYSNIRGVLSTSEYYIEVAAAVAKSYGLFGNQLRAINNCRNKRLFYELMDKEHLPIPQTKYIHSLKDLSSEDELRRYPVVVKPLMGSGSVGVKKCADFSQLKDQLLVLSQQPRNERGLLSEEGVLLQEYIEGREYSAEYICCGSHYHLLGFTRKMTTGDPYFIESGHDFPYFFPKELQHSIETTLVRAFNRLGFDFGPAHVEFKVCDSRIVLIEINPRLAGGMIPELINHACGIDIYRLILQLYTQGTFDLTLEANKGSSIRFFIPQVSGKIVSLPHKDDLMSYQGVVDVGFSKSAGAYFRKMHDYRDRIGYLITVGSNSMESQRLADSAIQKCLIEVQEESIASQKGRLAEGPHPTLQRINQHFQSNEKRLFELDQTVLIDLAHVLMLCQQGLIDRELGKQLLKGIRSFKELLKQGLPLMDYSRGTYYAYENYLRQTLGVAVSGLNHFARSRNDINATLFHLSCRSSFRMITRPLVEFVEMLLRQAKLKSKEIFPIYSQHQPAAPATYGFYLLSFYYPIKRVMEDLQSIEEQLNTLPLGAGTGCGTDVAIDQVTVAKWLGFKSVYPHALDAIANRDLAIRYQAILARLCMVFSRMAQDYQLWTTQEFQLCELPDNLCGSSSMMPQKKNPYLLELVKSMAADVISSLNDSLFKMHKVPTGNSIEVSHAAYCDIDGNTSRCRDIIDLMHLVVEHAVPVQTNSQSSIEKGLSMASFIANELVRERGISFREAHLLVGETIRKAYEGKQNPYEAMLNLIDRGNSEGRRSIAEVIDHLKYGGGPHSNHTEKLVDEALLFHSDFLGWLNRQESDWECATQRLMSEAESL